MGRGGTKSNRWTGLKEFSKEWGINYGTLKRIVYGRDWPGRGVENTWKLLRQTGTVTKGGTPFAKLMPEEYRMKDGLMAYPFEPDLAKISGLSLSFVDKVMRHKVWVTEKSKAVWQVATGLYGEEIMKREGARFCREYAEWKQAKTGA